MSDEMDWLKYFDGVHEGHRKQEAEFMRLAAEPCMKRPNKGDRVLVAVGFLGMGFLWVRREGLVIECGDTSFHVELEHQYDFEQSKPKRRVWVHQALITEVLNKEPTPCQPH